MPKSSAICRPGARPRAACIPPTRAATPSEPQVVRNGRRHADRAGGVDAVAPVRPVPARPRVPVGARDHEAGASAGDERRRGEVGAEWREQLHPPVLARLRVREQLPVDVLAADAQRVVADARLDVRRPKRRLPLIPGVVPPEASQSFGASDERVSAPIAPRSELRRVRYRRWSSAPGSPWLLCDDRS